MPLCHEDSMITMRISIALNLLFLKYASCFLNDEPYEPSQTESNIKGMAKLPCRNFSEVDDNSKVRTPALVIWFKYGIASPVYSVDFRQVKEGSHWSSDHIFGSRAYFNVDESELIIERVKEADSGQYKCRIDFEKSPTKNFLVNFSVIAREEVKSVETECQSGPTEQRSRPLNPPWRGCSSPGRGQVEENGMSKKGPTGNEPTSEPSWMWYFLPKRGDNNKFLSTLSNVKDQHSPEDRSSVLPHAIASVIDVPSEGLSSSRTPYPLDYHKMLMEKAANCSEKTSKFYDLTCNYIPKFEFYVKILTDLSGKPNYGLAALKKDDRTKVRLLRQRLGDLLTNLVDYREVLLERGCAGDGLSELISRPPEELTALPEAASEARTARKRQREMVSCERSAKFRIQEDRIRQQRSDAELELTGRHFGQLAKESDGEQKIKEEDLVQIPSSGSSQHIQSSFRPSCLIDPIKEESCLINPIKEEPCLIDSIKEESFLINSIKEESCMIESIKEESCLINPIKEESCLIDSIKEESCLINLIKEESAAEEPASFSTTDLDAVPQLPEDQASVSAPKDSSEILEAGCAMIKEEPIQLGFPDPDFFRLGGGLPPTWSELGDRKPEFPAAVRMRVFGSSPRVVYIDRHLSVSLVGRTPLPRGTQVTPVGAQIRKRLPWKAKGKGYYYEKKVDVSITIVDGVSLVINCGLVCPFNRSLILGQDFVVQAAVWFEQVDGRPAVAHICGRTIPCEPAHCAYRRPQAANPSVKPIKEELCD